MGSSFQTNPAARNDLGTSNFDPRGPSSPASMSASSSSFHQAEPRSFHSLASAQYQTISPPGRRQSVDKSSELLADRRSAGGMPSILLRKLPTNMSKESLNGMLLFAEDLVDAHFANPTDSADEAGYSCAIARFRTPAAAHEAQRRLHGKPNPSGDATLVVDVLVSEGPSHYGSKSPDPNKQLSTSASSRGSSVNGHSTRQSSRFNSTFQSMGSVSEKLAAMPNGASLESDYYLPPTSRGGTIGDQRVTGKAMINDDSADDETGELLKDPVAYARNGQISTGRRQSTQQIPLNRMANLTLNTSTANSHPPSQMVSPTNAGFSAGREMHGIQSPASAMSPTAMGSVMVGMNPMSPHSAYPLSPSFPRHQYPPANPADQNPPCNTLYVGNLPIDTSEDELKAMFSKQRGYKRLCFRTKHNGPMCFVEFEDVSFATKALNELYGQPLHNSVKGGIRLSFSKNPLGVRTGQQNSLNSPLSPGGLGLGALGAPPGFSTANGPPPGLAVPPGLSPPIGAGSGMNGFFGPSSAQGTPVGRGSHNYPPSSTPGLNPIGTGYSDVMFGR